LALILAHRAFVLRRAVAVDGTSGPVLAIDEKGNPLGNALLYNDVGEAGFIARIAAALLPSTAAWGAQFLLPDDVIIVTGTTAGCAAFLASGAKHAGDGVT
jgi:hypothetical protein